MSWTTKESQEVLASRIRIRKNLVGLKKNIPSGIGPYTTKPGQTEGDHLGFSDFDKVFNDYDDSNIKSGYPYVDIYGNFSVKSPAKCAYCNKPMITNYDKDLIYCPHCRRQHAISMPQEDTHGYRSELESGDPKTAINSPTDSEANFDTSVQNLHVPGDLF
jgi:hypothetical protein